MTNGQKAQRLEEIAACPLCMESADGKLLREAAAMIRERGESGWTAQFEREYKSKTLAVVEAGPIGWYWYVDGSADYEAEIAPTLQAAQAAAVAWVDEQEGRDA